MLRGSGALGLFVVLTALPAGGRAEGEEHGVTQVEFAAAEGSGSGTFGCAQQTRVRYVRAAVEVRHSEREATAPQGQGMTVVLGAAVDGTHSTIIEPPPEPPLEGRALGESWLQGRVGGHMRLGYRHRFFGLEGGIAGVVVPSSSTYASFFPQGEVSLGLRDLLYFMGGVGASQLTMQLNFAYPYLGVGFRPARNLEVEALWGVYDAGLSYVDRVDVIWRLRMSRKWAFRGGLAVGEFAEKASLSREASLGLQFTP